MWVNMMPKRGQLEFLSRINSKVLEIISSEDDDTMNVMEYPYVDMDQRGFVNILFTQDYPPNDRGNISVMF